MGLLEKLWDDTLAGPQPDSGLGRLRKFNTFASRPTPSKEMANGGDGIISSSSGENQEEVKISRKIMIVRPPGYNSPGSAPASPAGSTPPSSPFSGSRSGAFRFRRRSTSDPNEKAEGEDKSFGNAPPAQDV